MSAWWRALAWLLLSTSLPPETHAATPTAAELVAQLNTLTKGHVYRGSRYAEGILYDRETIRRVEFEPSRGWLGVTVDDKQESAPVAVIIPLRETSVGAPNESAFSFSCGSPCIKTTSDTFAEAVQKLSASSSAKLNFAQHRHSIQFGCQAERCVAISRAVLQLAAMAKRASTTERFPEAAEIVARINALTAKLDYVAPDGTRVMSYRYTTSLNREKRELTVTRDVESFVATNASRSRSLVRTTIPLCEVSTASFPKRFHRPRGWTFEVHEEGLACHQRKQCVEAAAPALGTRNVYQGFAYECEASKALELKQALEQLVTACKAPRP